MFVSALLTVVFSLCVQAQTLVFHECGGAETSVSLPTDMHIEASSGVVTFTSGSVSVDIPLGSVLAVTFRGKKGDVNGDQTVDVADIATIIDIMAGEGGDDNNGGGDNNGGDVAGSETYTVNGVSFTMVGVEGGTFQMGATAEQGSDAYDSEKPAHQVTVSSFSIGQTEVTQALWYAVMGQKPTSGGSQWNSTDGLGDNHPAYYVSWDDCQEFITKLNQLTGKQFRLPTEAEWEYAARGGNKSQGYKYAGSNTIGDVAWYTENSSLSTHDVATKQANELGIYDMSGNVWEWCSDWYGSYSSDAQTNPTGAASGSNRVYRGGCWINGATYCRVANREWYSPTYASRNLGFRLAL